MSHLISLILFVFAAAALSCSAPDEPPGPPYRAYVIDQTKVDPETGRADFEVAPRELHRLTSFRELDGPSYRILRGGELHAQSVVGTSVVDGQFEDGEAPDLRYRLVNGVAVARDFDTLIMLSAARQFERVIDVMDKYGPYPLETLLAASSGKLTVYFEPVFIAGGDISASVTLKFDAFFYPPGGAFGLARRSHLEDVPLSTDFAVIAHEMGHAVFAKAFDHGMEDDCNSNANNAGRRWFTGRLSSEYAILGLNEGFADWHSFMITSSPDALANQSNIKDDRNLRNTPFDYDALIERGIGKGLRLDSASACSGGHYCLGTLFAHALYNAFVGLDNDPQSDSARAAFTVEIAHALERTKSAIEDFATLPPADDSAAKCDERDNFDPEYDGKMVGAFLQAFIASTADELRSPLCAAFAKNFGLHGFPKEYRTECP